MLVPARDSPMVITFICTKNSYTRIEQRVNNVRIITSLCLNDGPRYPVAIHASYQCVSTLSPFLSTRPSDRNQILHTYSDRYGTHSHLNKLAPRIGPEGWAHWEQSPKLDFDAA